MANRQPKHSEQGLLYNDDAHRDAWSGLDHMGVWNAKITLDMLGKSFGEAIDALLAGSEVPVQSTGSGESWMESIGLTDEQKTRVAASKGIRTILTRPE